MRRLFVALAVASATLGASTLAHANGRFPAANQLVSAPDDPSTIFVRATFGILVTTDGGKDWDWICEQAIGLGPTTTVDPSIGITATTNVIASTFTSLFMSPDRGCTWNPATAFAHTLTQDVAVRADNPHIALALTNGYVSQSDAGVALYSSQIFTPTDDGVTWASAVPPIDPTLVLETLDVAASDPMRIYVSGIRGVGASSVGVLLESRDQGMTFTEHDIPLDLTNEVAPYIAAIDPTNADHVYVRTSPSLPTNPTRVILFDASQASDASTGLTTLLTMGDPTLGFAITPDGSKIYAGSLAGGLLVASTTDNMFHQTSTIRVRCALRSTERDAVRLLRRSEWLHRREQRRRRRELHAAPPPLDDPRRPRMPRVVDRLDDDVRRLVARAAGATRRHPRLGHDHRRRRRWRLHPLLVIEELRMPRRFRCRWQRRCRRRARRGARARASSPLAPRCPAPPQEPQLTRQNRPFAPAAPSLR